MDDWQVVGIFDADGGLGGEFRYVMGILAGGKHCSLCDITHGLNPLGRKEWKRACAAAQLEIRLVHRDRATGSQRKAAGTLPAVVAGEGDEWRVLVNSQELEGCAGDADHLITLLQSRLTAG